MEMCKKRLEENLGQDMSKNETEVEQTIIYYCQEKEHEVLDAALYPYFSYERKFRFTARVDILSPDTMWELKCTTKITQDHMMQVVLYSWIMQHLNPECPRSYKILNIRTGERLVLQGTLDDLTQIIVALLRGKYEKKTVIPDDDFIERHQEYIAKL
jgi:hypothetical protein